MSLEQGSDLPKNRYQRRRENRASRSTTESHQIGGGFNRMDRLITETAREANQVIGEQNGDLTKIVYKGKPFIYRWLETRRDLSLLLERTQIENLTSPVTSLQRLRGFDGQDFYSHRVGGNWFMDGLSLADIEQMPLLRLDQGVTLAREDIRDINRMFRSKTQEGLTVWQAMMTFATQALARPDLKIIIPEQLRPLHSIMGVYLDYYTGLMTNFDLDDRDEQKFYLTMDWSAPGLPQTLACYMPARLGITPASAIKYFQTRAELSFIPVGIWRRKLLHILEGGAKDAVRINNLPAEISKHQFYDGEMDSRVSTMIQDFYNGKGSISDEEYVSMLDHTDELMNKLTGIYWKRLQDDSFHNGKGFTHIQVPEHPLIDSIRIARQNRQTMIFILNMRDGGSHLTLEIDRNHKFYGFPAKLFNDRNDPVDRVLADVLGIILGYAKTRFPNLEPINIQDYFRNKTDEPAEEKSSRTDVDNIQRLEHRKRKTLPKILYPVSGRFNGPEPARISDDEQKFRVIYSRDQIVEQMPRNTQAKTIDQIMGTINGFEMGRISLADKISQAGDDIWELKNKGNRVLLQHVRGKYYSLYQVGYRGDNDRVFRRR